MVKALEKTKEWGSKGSVTIGAEAFEDLSRRIKSSEAALQAVRTRSERNTISISLEYFDELRKDALMSEQRMQDINKLNEQFFEKETIIRNLRSENERLRREADILTGG